MSDHGLKTFIIKKALLGLLSKDPEAPLGDTVLAPKKPAPPGAAARPIRPATAGLAPSVESSVQAEPTSPLEPQFGCTDPRRRRERQASRELFPMEGIGRYIRRLLTE